MADHSIETLLVRITELEGRLEATTVAPARPSSRRRRTVLVAGLLALALLVPVGVFASHSFTDVPEFQYLPHADRPGRRCGDRRWLHPDDVLPECRSVPRPDGRVPRP